MPKNRVFFPQAALDALLHGGGIELRGDELLVKAEARRYRLVEAVRVVAEVSGENDALLLVGRVKTLPCLRELGAEVLDGSMVVGNNAYEVVPGFVGAPIGSFLEHEEALRRLGRTALSGSDEELLSRLQLRVL